MAQKLPYSIYWQESYNTQNLLTPKVAKRYNIMLRSLKDYVHARDGDLGHIAYFIVDDEIWMIRYAVIQTRNWLPGKRVLVATQWISEIN